MIFVSSLKLKNQKFVSSCVNMMRFAVLFYNKRKFDNDDLVAILCELEVVLNQIELSSEFSTSLPLYVWTVQNARHQALIPLLYNLLKVLCNTCLAAVGLCNIRHNASFQQISGPGEFTIFHFLMNARFLQTSPKKLSNKNYCCIHGCSVKYRNWVWQVRSGWVPV